jgi:predicted nucleic acid-binding protein
MSHAFLDSDVLVYAFTDGDAKQDRALQVLEGGGLISVQCLNEFASVAARKLKMDWDRIIGSLGEIRRLTFRILPLDLHIHLHGLDLVEKYDFSIYDAMIVAAALSAECDTLYSEDMHHNLVVDGRLTITNPFAG